LKVSLRTGKLVTGTVWTLGGFGLGQVIRLATNVALARLLAPELFGTMLIVNTLMTGIQLFSDVGIGQNIIHSPRALDPRFYNTAWSVQIIRSIVIWLIILLAAVPVAHFYGAPILSAILPVSGFSMVLLGLASVSPAILQKKMLYGRMTVFNLATALISSALFITFAYLTPTIWALVWSGVVGTAVSTVLTYFLLPDLKQRFHIDKPSLSEITSFGKWVYLNSMVYFLSMNFDRLYLAKVVPLQVLGIYGIARSLSELFGTVATHLGNSVIFPFISSHSDRPRETLRRELVTIRFKFLALAALGCSLFIATADLGVKLLYDQRYYAAAWMLPVLTLGAWFSMLATTNESTLLGLGVPAYTAIANSVRFLVMVVGLPLSLKFKGLHGAIVTLVLVEVCRYAPVYIGQRRQRFSFGAQDLAITLAMFAMIGLWELLRWVCGLGTSFDSFFE
jgi:O-antigen/teichoic acid export membrane protein